MIPCDPTSLGIAQLYGFYVITINGNVGSTYRLETAPYINSNSWEPLLIFTLPESHWSYVDWASSGKSTRFYRTVLIE